MIGPIIIGLGIVLTAIEVWTARKPSDDNPPAPKPAPEPSPAPKSGVESTANTT